jgi:hypothetical protein
MFVRYPKMFDGRHYLMDHLELDMCLFILGINVTKTAPSRFRMFGKLVVNKIGVVNIINKNTLPLINSEHEFGQENYM